MIYRKYESKDISAVRDILEYDLGYNCELDSLKQRWLIMISHHTRNMMSGQQHRFLVKGIMYLDMAEQMQQ